MYKMMHAVLGKWWNLQTEAAPGEEDAEEEQEPQLKAVTGARELVRGIFTFEDMTKKGLRLTIQGHGGVLNNKGFMIDAKKVLYDGKALKYLLTKSGVNISRYQNVRLVCCHSANSKMPLGQQVADEFNLPTKGYVGQALTYVSLSMLRAFIDDYPFEEELAELFSGKEAYMHKGVSWQMVGGRRKAIENLPGRFKPRVADIIEDKPASLLS